MKWLKWIASWFGGETKSLGSLGIGLKAALSGGAPGGWASDHREETAHNTGFNYIAIHAIAAQVAGATVTVFADGDQQTLRQSRRKTLAIRVGSFAHWKSTYGADDRETDPLPTTHPLVRLLRRPNPYESGASFRYRQAQQIRLTGTCLIWNVPSVSGPTCERYVIPTAMASPVAPSMELPRGGWRINPVASRYTPIIDDGYVDCPSWYLVLGQIIDARQVQIIRLPHAWYLDDGQSPLSAGAKWVDAGEAVDEARFHQLKNGIDPSVVWNLPPDVSPDQDEIDRVQAKISAKYGGPENVGRVMVAQNGTSVTPLSATPKDMCYTEGFHDFKSAVLALHQTPPVAVGLQEPGAYAAYNASMKAWRHSAVQPLCDMLAESDTEHLAPEFGEGLTVEIESDTVDDTELIEQQLQNDLAAKVRTKNEWRAVRGMPPLPGNQGDQLVGTDDAQNSKQVPAETANTGIIQSDHEGNQSRSRRTIGNAEQATISESLKAADRTGNVREEQSPDRLKPNSPVDKPGTPDTRENDDDRLRAELIAEILYGVYGEKAFSVLEATPEVAQKAFDPERHPRGQHGRFIPVRSQEEVEAAKQAISEVLQGGTFIRTDHRILNALRILSTAQLKSVHYEHGVKIPPDRHDRLVESVWARLIKNPISSTEETGPPFSVRQLPHGNVEVYVQHEDKLNRILNRKLKQEEWGHIVGAQPGSRVYVYPAGDNSVNISVEHNGYRARRLVTKSEIRNEDLEVLPEMQGKGLGTKILSQQVESASKHGFKFLTTQAVGMGTELREKSPNPDVGYLVWPKLGYDGDIRGLMEDRETHGSAEEMATAKDFFKQFPRVKNVSEMMLTKKRKDWWEKYGGEFEGKFDLRKSSRSRQTLAKRLEENAKKKEKRANSKSLDSVTVDHRPEQSDEIISTQNNGWFPQPNEISRWNSTGGTGEHADPLTPEDEEILDRIWEELGRELGIKDLDVGTESDS